MYSGTIPYIFPYWLSILILISTSMLNFSNIWSSYWNVSSISRLLSSSMNFSMYLSLSYLTFSGSGLWEHCGFTLIFLSFKLLNWGLFEHALAFFSYFGDSGVGGSGEKASPIELHSSDNWMQESFDSWNIWLGFLSQSFHFILATVISAVSIGLIAALFLALQTEVTFDLFGVVSTAAFCRSSFVEIIFCD